MTLREAIVQAHCRQGKAAGTTKDGAFWRVIKGTADNKRIKIRTYGGNGIGQSSASVDNWLELRHYRDGAVRARVHVDAWHVNGARSGAGDWWLNADAILDFTTAEAVIVALKGIRSEDHGPAYSDMYESELTTALWALGIPASEPAPDEVVAIG